MSRKFSVRPCWALGALLALSGSLLSFVVVATASAAPSCRELLNPTQMKALTQLKARRGYEARVLYSPKDQRTIVLVGEYHVKDQTDHDLGLELISEFKYRGLEGVHAKNYFWGELFIKAIRANNSPEKYPELNHGSTLIDATKRDSTLNQQKELAQQMYQIVSQGELTKEDLVERIQTQITNSSINTAASQQVGVVNADLDWEAVLEDALELLNGRPASEVLPNEKNFMLEKNHRPPFREQMAQLLFSVGHLTSLWGPQPNGLFGLREKGLKFLESNIIFRDLTMVKSTLEVFDQNPDIHLLLVLVGKMHVDNQVQLLEAVGYELIPFD